jgi:hypothetical protein
MDNSQSFRIEKIAVSIASVIVFIALVVSAGGPIFSDEIGYIASGLNGVKNPPFLNRYFHIYIQAFFLNLAPSPILGVRIFWSLEIILTALMIYMGVRLIDKKATFLHSLVAVALFFSVPFFLKYGGVTIIDFTSMVVVTTMFFLYLLSIRFEKVARWFILGMGAMLFFSYETKEVNISAGFVVLGFGLEPEGKFSWKLFINKGRWFLLGILAGIVSYMVMGAIVVRDPFWGFRIAEYKEYIITYANLFLKGHKPYDYLGTLMRFLPLFFLFLVGGVQNQERIGVRQKIVWFFPFVMCIALTIAWNRSPFGTLDRLLFSTIPAMCMFSPVILAYDLPKNRKEKSRFWKLLLILIMIVSLVVFLAPYMAKAIGWDYTEFTDSFLAVIFISILLIFLGVKKSNSAFNFSITLALIALVCAKPLKSNFLVVIVEKQNRISYDARMSPFDSFKNDIQFSSNMHFLISLDINKSFFELGTGLDDVVGLFDLFFDKPATRKNFAVVDNQIDLKQRILKDSFTYVLLTEGDWHGLTSQPGVQAQIESFYSISQDKDGRIYFLKIK